MFSFFSSLLQSAIRVVQQIGRVIEEFFEDQELEPEQIEEVIRVIVRIALTYQIFIARVVETFIQSIVSTIKEYQKWEPLQP